MHALSHSLTYVLFLNDSLTHKNCFRWLDYDYVDGCNDAKKLKAILSVLRSGKEGSYPEVFI